MSYVKVKYNGSFSIEYRRLSDTEIAVYTNEKKSGTIHKREEGFVYIPRGCKTGSEVFPSLTQLKKSLEN